MPPSHLNPQAYTGYIRRANLVLYGTIGLCAVTTFQTLSTRNNAQRAAAHNDSAAFERNLRKYLELEKHYVCSRTSLAEGRYYTLVSAAFNHGNGLHLFANMLGLWSFGKSIAYAYGAGAFIAVFYGGAVLGNLLCLGLDRRYGKTPAATGREVGSSAGAKSSGVADDEGRRESSRATGFIGASGGVCAMTAANACINPWGRMIVGIMFIPIPVYNVVGCLGFAAFSAWAQTSEFQRGVAHLGHLGGLLYGVAWFVAKFKHLPRL